MEDVQVCKTLPLKLEEDTPRTEKSCDVRQDTRVRPTLAIPRLYNEFPISHKVINRQTPASSLTKLVLPSKESNIYEVVKPKPRDSFSSNVSDRNIPSDCIMLEPFKENSPVMSGSVFLPGLGQTLPSRNCF